MVSERIRWLKIISLFLANRSFVGSAAGLFDCAPNDKDLRGASLKALFAF
jgi:hypothetical protein